MIGEALRHYLGVRSGWELPQTQTTHLERELLRKYLPGHKRVVEVGVFEGFTTRALADGSDYNATVYAIDPFSSGRFGICWGLKIAKHHNRAHVESGKLRLVRSLSVEVGTKVPSEVDYVFIDADHSLEGIRSDWGFWSARVAVGGLVALHDVLSTIGQSEERQYGSHIYFQDHIRHDPGYEIIDQADLLAVLKKRPENKYLYRLAEE